MSTPATGFRIALILLLASPASPGGDFLLQIGEVSARSGDPVKIAILADAPQPYQGLSFTVSYPPGELEVERVGVEDTILEALHADFVQGGVYPARGIFVLGALVDAAPPFDGELVPAVGFPMAVAYATGRVIRTTPGDIPLIFSTSLERPAVPNLFAVDNHSVLPQTLLTGRVSVLEPPRVAAFIRGDANMDRLTDIADPIWILEWRFQGGTGPMCDDAVDVNADDELDITDAIYLLLFLFQDGQRPLPPSGSPGPDPFEGNLDCVQPLEWLPGY